MTACNCRGEVTRDVALAGIVEFMQEFNHHRSMPFHGMVDARVKDEDFECCPVHPDALSCPQSGCQHCKGATMIGAELARNIDWRVLMPPGKHLAAGVPVLVRALDSLDWANVDTGIWLRHDEHRTYDRFTETVIFDEDEEQCKLIDVLLDLSHPRGMGHALTVLFGWMNNTDLGYVALPGLKTQMDRAIIVDRHMCGESTDKDRAIVAAGCIAIG